MSITVYIDCTFLFCADLSYHTISVTTHVGCTIIALVTTCRQLESHPEKSVDDGEDLTVCINTFYPIEANEVFMILKVLTNPPDVDCELLLSCNIMQWIHQP